MPWRCILSAAPPLILHQNSNKKVFFLLLFGQFGKNVKNVCSLLQLISALISRCKKCIETGGRHFEQLMWPHYIYITNKVNCEKISRNEKVSKWVSGEAALLKTFLLFDFECKINEGWHLKYSSNWTIGSKVMTKKLQNIFLNVWYRRCKRRKLGKYFNLSSKLALNHPV